MALLLRSVGVLCLLWWTSAHQPARSTREAVPGLEAVLTDYDVVLFGETHGTVENPRFVEDAALLALHQGRSVTVALEIPHEEDPLLQAYLDFQRADFITGAFWHSPYKDGRSSEAMRELIKRVHDWRAQGYPVALVTLDPVQTPPPGDVHQPLFTGVTRDEAMADQLMASIERAPDNLFLVLTGNLHQRLYRGTPWDQGYRPMGLLFARSARRLTPGTRIVSLDVHYYGGGEAWACQGTSPSSCGQIILTEKLNDALPGEDAPRGVTLSPGREGIPSSGWVYFTERVHASAPAVRQAS
jgi:hypothetical protein